jgi:hypothetical protein
VRLLKELRELGVMPNAITYGQYTRAVAEDYARGKKKTEEVLSIAANAAHRMTWFCIHKTCALEAAKEYETHVNHVRVLVIHRKPRFICPLSNHLDRPGSPVGRLSAVGGAGSSRLPILGAKRYQACKPRVSMPSACTLAAKLYEAWKPRVSNALAPPIYSMQPTPDPTTSLKPCVPPPTEPAAGLLPRAVGLHAAAGRESAGPGHQGAGVAGHEPRPRVAQGQRRRKSRARCEGRLREAWGCSYDDDDEEED